MAEYTEYNYENAVALVRPLIGTPMGVGTDGEKTNIENSTIHCIPTVDNSNNNTFQIV